MASASEPASRTRSALLAAAAALGSGVCAYLGTGLHPIAPLTWFALLPVLLLAPRVRWGWAAGAAAVAWIAGQSGLWSYFAGPLRMPLPVLIGVLALYPQLAAGSTVLFRALVRRNRPISAMLAVPVVWVAGEYLISVSQPHGAWLSLGYTQADVRPVLQVAAVTGVWGVTFLITWFPAAIAALAAPGASGRRLRVIGTAAVILTVSSGYWGVRLLAPQTGPTIRVAVLGGPIDAELGPDTADGQAQLTTYQQQIGRYADAGASVVVLPEKVFDTDERTWPMLADPLAKLAAERHVTIVVGATVRQGGTATNVAVAFPATGGAAVTYTKHHLIPGLESDLTEGDGPPVVLPGGLGLIVCKDLDFPGLVRQDRNADASILLAPAWDMGSDGWLHGRMAIVRGIESGTSVARAGRNGLLTISDPTGDVVAEADAVHDPDTAIVADVPTGTGRTLYALIGDWFAWLCTAATVLLALLAARKGRSAPRNVPLDAADRPGNPSMTVNSATV
ncbi:apolipoprotein N-acyltransferase [Dactylosporangium sp. CA-233914]|uniref:apolipoprotein N-acyltransferase n=1 Tax=Dactylosporangium sp. CA-233914 TaxID=3239934 RepID=UPI003D8C6926